LHIQDIVALKLDVEEVKIIPAEFLIVLLEVTRDDVRPKLPLPYFVMPGSIAFCGKTRARR
jgi:hypothetical protein